MEKSHVLVIKSKKSLRFITSIFFCLKPHSFKSGKISGYSPNSGISRLDQKGICWLIVVYSSRVLTLSRSLLTNSVGTLQVDLPLTVGAKCTRKKGVVVRIG